MISPSKQKIIQVDVTNACPHKCSNCTRFVGHHKKPYFMTVPQAKKAIDSLQDYPGMVGIMGGEPTLHPQFKEIVEYVNKVRPEPKNKNRYSAIENFAEYRNKTLNSLRHKKGLWTSLGDKYVENYELIQDSFNYQCVNDHTHEGEHIALLVPYDELGFSKNEWLKYRDACWIQRLWSASITPKGAFFCEVAGALDMLFGGKGGWKVEPDWWRREPKDFGKQLMWCELCSACLPIHRRKAIEGVDDVSPKMAAKLKAAGSTKPVKVFDIDKYDVKSYEANQKCEPYLPNGDNKVRVKKLKTVNRIDAVVVCVGYDDYLSLTLPRLSAQVDSVTIVTDKTDLATQLAVTKWQNMSRWYKEICDINVIFSKRLHEGGAVFAKGRAINEGIASIENPEWVLVLDADILVPSNLHEVKDLVLNPGALYYTRRWGCGSMHLIPSMLKAALNAKDFSEVFDEFACKEVARVSGRKGNAIEQFPFGYFQLFNVNADLFKTRLAWYPERSKTAEYDDATFGYGVYAGKTTCLPVPKFDVIHIPHGLFGENWGGRRTPRLEKVFADPEKYRAKASRFKCVKKCVYKSKLWVEGEILTTENFDVPKHFERMET